jgi:hypothetical protein
MRYDNCRQCTKRRIKCDQGTPRCAKCIKKGLECSGIGKKYHFVGNQTPETIGPSSSARSRSFEASPDEGDALVDASNTAVCSSSRLNSDDSTGLVADENDDVEDTVFSPSGAQQFIGEAVVHRPGQRGDQMSKFPLHYRVNFYKPGQMMLLDHCKSVLLEVWLAFTSHGSRTKTYF